jgi:cyanophycin synthetase
VAVYCPGRVVWFARRGAHATLAAHRAAGGRVVFARSGTVVLAEGEGEAVLPVEEDGPAEVVLAAAAAAWALGLRPEAIRAGLESRLQPGFSA